KPAPGATHADHAAFSSSRAPFVNRNIDEDTALMVPTTIAFILFLAICALVAATPLFEEYRRSRKRTATAQGKVLRLRFGGLLGTNVRRPEIEFVDSRGQRFEFHSSMGASWNPWPEGSSVQVFYDPEDPTNAEIKPSGGLILFGVGVGSAILGF